MIISKNHILAKRKPFFVIRFLPFLLLRFFSCSLYCYCCCCCCVDISHVFDRPPNVFYIYSRPTDRGFSKREQNIIHKDNNNKNGKKLFQQKCFRRKGSRSCAQTIYSQARSFGKRSNTVRKGIDMMETEDDGCTRKIYRKLFSRCRHKKKVK